MSRTGFPMQINNEGTCTIGTGCNRMLADAYVSVLQHCILWTVLTRHSLTQTFKGSWLLCLIKALYFSETQSGLGLRFCQGLRASYLQILCFPSRLQLLLHLICQLSAWVPAVNVLPQMFLFCSGICYLWKHCGCVGVTRTWFPGS